MPRIPLISGDGLSKAQSAVYDRIISGPRGVLVGPLRAALHSPELAERWQHFGAFLRYDAELSLRLRELAIICCGRYWNSPLEWQIHAEAAAKSGVSEATIEAIRTARRPTFADPDEAAVYAFARELLSAGQTSDAVYLAAHERLGTVQLVELAAIVGYYTLVAMTVNVHDIPPPAILGEPARPGLDDGLAPRVGTTALPAGVLNLASAICASA